ncbi:MAG: circadian clock protein LdpA [Xenococcaceae cyanobacterium]
MSDLYYPLHSLKEGNWFKLICGASFQHLPAVRSLTLAYTLAGADCIDVAADPAVIATAKDALKVARALADAAAARGFQWRGLPRLMVSLNDGEDPHFRKAEFDSTKCPPSCPRPCEKICPAGAIAFQDTGETFSGVIDQRCYGCGRCLPVCPRELIFTRSYVSTPTAIASLIQQMGIDTIEIHTQVGNWQDFQRLWQAITPWINQLKLLAISCPDDPNLIDYLHSLYDSINPLPCPLIWQTDGRPMSGDIGIGTTHATVKLAQKVLAAGLPGYVQLAGGTNHYTVTKLQAVGLLKDGNKGTKRPAPSYSQSPITNHQSPFVSGIAYGSYARSLLSPILEKLETVNHQNLNASQLENCPDLLWQAVTKAHSLVSQLKPSSTRTSDVSSVPRQSRGKQVTTQH